MSIWPVRAVDKLLVLLIGGDEMGFAIQDIFTQSYVEFMKHYQTNFDIDKVAMSIIDCKTSALGGNKTVCKDCKTTHIHLNSCRNRHCPCCQDLNKEKWIDNRMADVVDANYFHAVFTIPHELNGLMFSNKKVLYDLLFRSSADTLNELSQNPRFLGAKIGFTSILHTWGSNLSYHPHIHSIVLGGGLSNDNQFIASKERFLFPQKVVAKLFKGKFLSGLKLLYDQRKLNIPFSHVMLKYEREFNHFYSMLNEKDWVLQIKETFKGAENVINYLGRYTHNIAISNSRILKVDAELVTFRIKDYKNGKPGKMSLKPVEFIRRFLMHVLPKRFVRIRHYGLLSSRHKRKKMTLVRKLVGGTCFKPRFKGLSTLGILKKLYSIDPLTCKKCGSRHIEHRFIRKRE